MFRPSPEREVQKAINNDICKVMVSIFIADELYTNRHSIYTHTNE